MEESNYIEGRTRKAEYDWVSGGYLSLGESLACDGSAVMDGGIVLFAKAVCVSCRTGGGGRSSG